MSPKRYSQILLGILGVLIVGGGVGYYYALRYMQATSASYGQKQTQLAIADKQLDYLQQLTGQYQRQIIPILPLMNEALPHVKNQTELLAQLQTLAGQSGLSISTITFAAPAGLPGPTSQTIAAGGVLALSSNFTITGTYAQLQTFLSGLENLSRLVTVTQLNISPGSGGHTINYAISMFAYLKP